MAPDEPLDEIAVKRVIRNIIERGTVRWTALQRLPARDLRAQPVFYGFARLAHGKVIPVTVLSKARLYAFGWVFL